VLAVLTAPLAPAQQLQTDLVPQVTAVPGGGTRYQYTITNLAQSSLNVDGFVLDVPATANLRALTGPADWDIFYSAGSTQVTWATVDLPTYSPLRPGQSGTFSFETDLGPGSVGFTITGIDDTFQFTGRNTGVTTGPVAPVPEPGTGLLIAAGVLGLARASVLAHRRVRGRPG
jgi:hypothetical protein